MAEFIHEPAKPNGRGLVLTHGAGGNCRSPLLVSVAEAFCEAGVRVMRYDLPFRQKRPTGSPSPSGAAADRAGLREAVLKMQSRTGGPVWLGGHSYGGRQATMLASEEPQLAAALMLLAYPLHPPGRPEQPRTAHFPALRTPAVFIHGSRDPFGSPDEMRAALGLIPAQIDFLLMEKAGHDLGRGKLGVGAAALASRILAF
jgi:predicted alpha/beta-hydrolase family hydrolase